MTSPIFLDSSALDIFHRWGKVVVAHRRGVATSMNFWYVILHKAPAKVGFLARDLVESSCCESIADIGHSTVVACVYVSMTCS